MMLAFDCAVCLAFLAAGVGGIAEVPDQNVEIGVICRGASK